MFDKKKLHLVPQIVQDRAQSMLNENNLSASENIAMQLETIVDFCELAIQQYEKKKIVQTPRVFKKGEKKKIDS